MLTYKHNNIHIYKQNKYSNTPVKLKYYSEIMIEIPWYIYLMFKNFFFLGQNLMFKNLKS